MSTLCTYLAVILLVSSSQGVRHSPLIKSTVLSPSIRDDVSKYRLPNDVVPISYNISLYADLDGKNFTFTGESVIKLNFTKSTYEISLHIANDLEYIPKFNLKCENGAEVVHKKFELRNNSVLTFVLDKTILSGAICDLTVKYKGKDIGQQKGFYRTSYIDKQGNQKWMASTQFEPIAARHVFPCWDEPAFKANFSIAIKHSRKYLALSNMPVIGTKTEKDDHINMTTYFAESPKMSSYLVAFAVGDFVSVDKENLDFQVWSRRDIVDNGIYALKIGSTILKTLENYTDFSYEKHGFPKMDSLAVPELSASAMENWGLVIYTEKDFLYAENLSSTSQKETVTGIIAHELAHQWFGNLVTANWWDDIWLNEGFANYFEYIIVNQIEPTWRVMEKFVVNNLQARAFVADSKNESHPIYQARESDKDISKAFDVITYSKTGSILRTISHVVGETKFQTALQNYLKNNAFGSVKSTELFKEFENVYDGDKKNLRTILENWINVPGYPVVTVKIDDKMENATITQSRFLNEIGMTSNEKYWIPLNYVTDHNLNDTNTTVTHWLEPTSNSTTINLPKNSKFVIFNKQQFGYYRVNYDNKIWLSIANYLKTVNHTNIHVLNRAQLIDDALNLAKNGQLEYSIALCLIEYLKVESDFIPWFAAWRGIEYIHKFVANTDLAATFKNFVLDISENVVKDVQSANLSATNHVMKLKRIKTLTWACTFGSNSCQSEATVKFENWLNNSEENVLSADDEKWILCAGVRNADQTTWYKLWKKYLNDKNVDILTALGCTSNVNILNGYLIKVMDYNKTENLSEVFTAIYTGSNEGVNVVFDFITKNYKKIIELNGYSRDQLKSDFISLTGSLTNESQHNKLKQFIDHADEEFKDTVREALKNVEKNLNVINVRLTQFKLYFKESTPENSGTIFKLSTIALLTSLFISQLY